MHGIAFPIASAPAVWSHVVGNLHAATPSASPAAGATCRNRGPAAAGGATLRDA
ncbi:hypothetical protein ACP70R_022548 [Stipagrostis hirtigluma subsp. patula]